MGVTVEAVGRAGWSGGAEDAFAVPSRRSPSGANVIEVYRDSQVRIVSDERVSERDARALASRIERAYAYDQAQQHWDDTGPLQRPLTVAVLSRGAFGRLTGDSSGATAGVTTGPDLFAVPDTVLGRRTAQDENTIAHELGHVQDFREAGARLEQVPIYLQEGKEYLLGESYPLAEGLKNPHLAYVADALSKVTAKDAAWLLKNFRHAQDEQRGGNVGFFGEVTGALFVEFLRVHLHHPDAIARVADVISDVGRGDSYDHAFRTHFGRSAREVEQAFVDFIAETEGRPEARLAGTLFDQNPDARSTRDRRLA